MLGGRWYVSGGRCKKALLSSLPLHEQQLVGRWAACLRRRVRGWWSECVCVRARGYRDEKERGRRVGGKIEGKGGRGGEGERERGGGKLAFLENCPFSPPPLSPSLSLSLSLPLYRSLSDFSPFFLSACCPRRRRRPRPRRCRRPCRRCGSSVTWSPRLKAYWSKALAASPKCG